MSASSRWHKPSLSTLGIPICNYILLQYAIFMRQISPFIIRFVHELVTSERKAIRTLVLLRDLRTNWKLFNFVQSHRILHSNPKCCCRFTQTNRLDGSRWHKSTWEKSFPFLSNWQWFAVPERQRQSGRRRDTRLCHSIRAGIAWILAFLFCSGN